MKVRDSDKGRWVSSRRVWAAGFHHVRACSCLAHILKLMQFISFISQLFWGPQSTTVNWNHSYWMNGYRGTTVHTTQSEQTLGPVSVLSGSLTRLDPVTHNRSLQWTHLITAPWWWQATTKTCISQWHTQEFFSGGFNKFSWGQRAERMGIWER
jgi:hypothetical protein